MTKSDKSQVVITSDHIKAAKKLHFINHGDGGPLITMPRSALSKYFGALDKDGKVTSDNTHYESICNSDRLFKNMLGHELLILREDGSSIAFYSIKDGGYLLYWVGADTAEAVLAVALASSYRPVRKDKSWMVPPGGLVLFSAAEHGGELSTIVEAAIKKGRTHEKVSETPFLFIDLSAGSYEVSKLSMTEFRGTALHPKGKVEELMVQAYKLSKVGKYEKKEEKNVVSQKPAPKKKKAHAPQSGNLLTFDELTSSLTYENVFPEDNRFKPVSFFSAQGPTQPNKVWVKGKPLLLDEMIICCSPPDNASARAIYKYSKHPKISVREALILLFGKDPKKTDSKPNSIRHLVWNSLRYFPNQLLDDERQKFIPLIPQMLHSATKAKRSTLECCQLGVDWYINIGIPFWLEKAEFTNHANTFKKTKSPKSIKELNALASSVEKVQMELIKVDNGIKCNSLISGAVYMAHKLVYGPSGMAIADELIQYWPNALYGIAEGKGVYQGDGGKLHEIWNVYNRVNDIVRYSSSIVLKRLAHKINLPKKHSDEVCAQLASILICKLREETQRIVQDAWGLLHVISE